VVVVVVVVVLVSLLQTLEICVAVPLHLDHVIRVVAVFALAEVLEKFVRQFYFIIILVAEIEGCLLVPSLLIYFPVEVLHFF